MRAAVVAWCRQAVATRYQPAGPGRRPQTGASRLVPAALLLLTAVLAACAPQTRITLLPQAQGQPSAVVVSTTREEVTLNQPFAVAEVGRDGRVTSSSTTAEALGSRHPALLSLMPPPAESFMMAFNTGSAELAPAERARLEAVIERARARPGGEIVVTGHTDRQGSVEFNDRLALERAQAIRLLFIARGFPPERIDAVGRGEREPLVPTDDGIAEPRNRRAVIVVR